MKTQVRSSSKTRDLDKTRKEILNTAFLEVYKHGFQGVSVDEIVKKTSLTKGAFYHHFPTKLELGYALVDEVIQPMIIDRWIAPLAASKNPLHGILKQMKTLIGGAHPEDYALGCPLNNLVQEMSPIDDGFKIRLQASLNSWVDGTDTLLKRAKKEGYLRADVNTKQLAYFIVMAHEGIYGMLKGVNDVKVFDALYASIRSYFKTLEK